jgi:hypothetical protein
VGGVCGNQTQQNKIFGGVLGPSADFSSDVMGKMKMTNIIFSEKCNFCFAAGFYLMVIRFRCFQTYKKPNILNFQL